MKVTNTTAFRMALLFAVVFELITVSALFFVYFTTYSEIQEQTDNELRNELNDLATTYQTEGIEIVTELVGRHEQYGKRLQHFYALVDTTNNHSAGNNNLIQMLPDIKSNKNSLIIIDVNAQNISEEDDALLRIAVMNLTPNVTLVIAQTQSSLIELQEHTFIALLSAIIVTLILALLSGIYMGRVVLLGINRIEYGLDEAIDSNFIKKIALPKKNDEFKSLTSKLNLMLERIENLIIGMRQVTDNVAHDLLRPLTRLRSRLEVTLLKPRKEQEYRDIMEQVVEDTDELITTFNTLLNIAQAEAKVQRDDWESVELSKLLEELSELYTAVAEEKQQSFVCRIEAPATIRANRQQLAQAISNLLENAIKYVDKGGNILLELKRMNKHPIISVSDNGSGIPASDRKRVLKRFQRLDMARSSPGSGLGLSMVDAIAKLHDATLLLEDNKPGLKISLVFDNNHEKI